jgi:ATP-dependent Clp protease ATP-binding subunit ClpA
LFDVFRAELVNRLDKVIIFDPLNHQDLVEIAKLQLNQLSDRLKEKNLKFQYTNAMIKELVSQDYDITFGARPLKRAIEEKIEGLLSEKILSGDFKNKSKITVDFKNGRFVAV